MGVYHAVHLRTMAIDIQVGKGIRRRLEVALDNLALRVYHYHIFRREVLVSQAAGFDDHQTTLWVTSADVATRPYNEIIAEEFEVQAIDFEA
jgi:hypothetical protein